MDGRWRVVVSVAAVCLVAAMGAGSVMAQEGGARASSGERRPTAAGDPAWGWVVARKPTSASYVPAQVDRGNSAGARNRVRRLARGSYVVVFRDIENETGGTAQVTALTSKPHRCALEDIGHFQAQYPGAVLVGVTCRTRTGKPVDAAFIASFLAAGDQHGTLGYMLALQPTEPAYLADPFYSFNSSGVGPIEVERVGPGSYRVGLPGLARPGGNVQVVHLGDAAIVCRSLDWIDMIDSERVLVLCRDTVGHPVDANFALVFADDVGLSGLPTRRAAYVRADRPKAASYRGSARYRYSSAGTRPLITRSGRGRYGVKLPGMPKGGSAHVTPVGPGKTSCVVSSIRTASSPQRVGVRCTRPNGDRADSAFSLTYTR